MLRVSVCFGSLALAAATAGDSSFLHRETKFGSFWDGSGSDAASSVLQLGEDRSEPNLRVRSQSVEESQSVQTDAGGRTVRVTKHCTDGHCQETTEVLGKQGDDEMSGALSQGGDSTKASSFEASMQHSMQQEVHRINNEMQEMQNQMDGVFKHAFGGAFGEETSGDSQATSSTGLSSKKAEAEAEEGLEGKEDDRSSSAVTSSSSSSSYSTETVVKNGQAVRRIRECKNGACSTRVEELGGSQVPDDHREVQEPQTEV
eukprot:CAMPEP_0206471362 /NCGR_PEP_ID=MMETSP0324_2-20121206/31513_1 /ASSEMBLY_ACC=CAM_ASM_000836 /TAXON_ID=2866 /ORGANISM="Crypthecodinium cohnii, Strain Seligo" /LENGTH=258 /DNA_ID=CAMNT_0053945663 /DNA_START=120 /DNA_END=896 /DNA_ORIENTATION=-